jgi:hypothetical protein
MTNMGNSVSTPRRSTPIDDGDDYVLIDARAVLLDLADEPRGEVRPFRRGVQPPAPAAPCDPEVEWQSFLGAARRGAVAEAAGPRSVWDRVTRRLHGVWGASKVRVR